MKKENIETGIFFYKNVPVVSDFYLADMYKIPLSVFHQIIKKDVKKFPIDSLYPYPIEDWKKIRRKCRRIYTLEKGFLPIVFTEIGVSMLFRIFTEDFIMDKSVEILENLVRHKNEMLSKESQSNSTKPIKKITYKHYKILKFPIVNQKINYLIY